MYFNNLHILTYVLIAIIGLIVGKFIAWCNIRIPEKKTVFSNEFFNANKEGLKLNYIFMITTAVIYVLLLYKFGVKDEFTKNLDLIKFFILTPMLLLVFSIDIQNRIIPNRINLTIFETGLIFTFIYGITNLNMAKEYILGMITGAGIFAIITVLGWIITGKEAMGLGDVKFMGSVGLFFGVNSIAEISLLSFFIGAICSIFILIIRFTILKNKDEYVPFGPFLVISTLACIFLPSNYVLNTFFTICKQIGDIIL